tara:strand:+ start:10065 stop:10631 length:567 start_codon:yes stop_codon:yes gene_type:complete
MSIGPTIAVGVELIVLAAACRHQQLTNRTSPFKWLLVSQLMECVALLTMLVGELLDEPGNFVEFQLEVLTLNRVVIAVDTFYVCFHRFNPDHTVVWIHVVCVLCVCVLRFVPLIPFAGSGILIVARLVGGAASFVSGEYVLSTLFVCLAATNGVELLLTVAVASYPRSVIWAMFTFLMFRSNPMKQLR